MRLADVIGRWLGRVEIVLAGADDDLREGEQALAAGDPMRARAAAHRVLEVAPDSPLGLALLADACEAAHLDAELALTLEELARRAPSSAEVWVRLGRARKGTLASNTEVRDALARALSVAEPDSDARREALLELADLDLAEADGARAELWLDRLPAQPGSPEATVRRAEARLMRGDAAGASRILERLEESPTDARAALIRGRTLALLGDRGAYLPLLRALVLDAPGASEALSATLASVPSDPQMRARIRSVVDAKGEQELARWRAAFARAEGAREAARRALRDAVEAGDAAAARPLLEMAIDDQDAGGLGVALRALPLDEGDPLIVDARAIAAAASSSGESSGGEGALDGASGISHPRVVPWAARVTGEVVARWLPAGGEPADWPALLARLDGHARTLADLGSIAAVADIASVRSHPLRLAVVGEFNAGKSTFINALIGADVAPTGILPTTATLHHLRWAPDPIARLFFASSSNPRERIVPLGDLRATLRSLDPETLGRVEILLPLDSLLRVEILDTPGFNAPDAHHARVARSALEEADMAIWLLDATQPMKQSERAVLEEAARTQLPLQLLVNKADRLSPADLARVLSAVDAALAETRLTSWTRPLAFSAKKALAGKLGDAKALAESGWPAVQALLDEQIVARHGELKERALRRRARDVVGRLRTTATANAERRRLADEATAAKAHALGLAAANLERDADRVTTDLARTLEPSAQAWGRDLALVFVGREPGRAARDSPLARYRVERAVAALAPALGQALTSLAPEGALPTGVLAPLARTLVRAAAEATPHPTPGRDVPPDALLLPLARAAVATLVERLFALSLVPAPKAPAAGLVRELDAWSAVLDRGCAKVSV